MVETGIGLLASERVRLAGVNPGTKSRLESGSLKGLRVGVLSELNLLGTDIEYFRDLASQTLCELRARGMAPMLFNGTVRPGEVSDAVTCPEFWDAVAQHRLDAAVILDVPSTEAWYDRVEALAVPAVGDFTPFSLENDRGMIVPGLRELRRQGASKIALLAWNRGNTLSLFQKELGELGLSTSPHWIRGDFNPALPGSGWETFREIWSARPEKPDGLLVTDNVFFHGAVQAIRELGIAVPQELRIVTHANRDGPVAPPTLSHTRFECDPRADAQIFVDLLARRLAGEAPPAEPVCAPFKVVHLAAGTVPERAPREERRLQMVTG